MDGMRTFTGTLLRLKFGSIAEEDTKIYSEGGELELWRESLTKNISLACFELGIYEKIAAEDEEFQVPLIESDKEGQMVFDYEGMQAILQDDSKNPGQDIAAPTCCMEQVYLQRIVASEMDFIESNKNAQTVAGDVNLKKRCDSRVPKRPVLDTSPNKSRAKKEQKELFCYERPIFISPANSNNAAASARSLGDTAALLTKQWPTDYPQSEPSPIRAISNAKMWYKVAELAGVAAGEA